MAMESSKFCFIHLKNKETILSNSITLKKLNQWGLDRNLKLNFYNFNQEFHPYQKQDFVNAFFKDSAVISSLSIFESLPIVTKVEYQPIHSTVTSIAFFDTLLLPENGIIQKNGEIQQCFLDTYEGFFIDDKLLAFLLVEEQETYNLYSGSERNEFIFHLFKHIYLGGEWCQRDFTIEPYLQFTKQFYKELISVERVEGSTNINIRSIIFKVVIYKEDGKPLDLCKPNLVQNFIYLIIDPFKRQVAVLTHHS